jgi:outer membrane protein assembly factor BamB
MRKLLAISITLLMLLAISPAMEPHKAEAFMFRGDLHRSGVYDSKAPENNTLLWSFDTGNYIIQSSPVVVDDRAYFGGDDTNVYCLDAQTGDEIWNYTTGNAVKSTPLVFDDVVYVGSTDGNFYAIDAESGEKQWNYTLPTYGQIWSSSAISNDLIFFGADDGILYALNISNTSAPDLEWTFLTGWLIQSSPAVNWPYVYIGSADGGLYCIWANNGTQKWVFEPIDIYDIYSTPTISNGSVYIGAGEYDIGGALYCIDALTGEEKWKFLPPGEGRFSEVYSSATVHNHTVFIHAWNKVPGPGEEKGTVFAIPEVDPNGDGNITIDEIKWEFTTWDNEGGSSPAVADGKVFVGSTNKKLYCLDEYTGEELWNLTTDGQIVASPFVANSVVYITSEDGVIYAIGGYEQAELEVQIIPEFPSIKSNRVMGISFVVTYRDKPVEGAFINVEVNLGNLSQNGASTFGDGSQRIKYTSSEVTQNTTVTVYARATKSGYPEGNSTTQFVIEPPTSYKEVSSGSTFSLSKYWLYLLVIFALIAINVVIIIIGTRKRNKIKEEPEMDEEYRD